MDNDAEKVVSKFYNTLGWETKDGITEDALKFEDLRECAKDYVSKCRLRVLKYIPDSGTSILDMASGPIQYKEYLEYSKNFKKRYCVDLSKLALDMAKEKIGDHGEFLHGSFFDIPMEESFFDCTVSLHTIYHMDKDKQEDAVRKLIYATKPGQPVIIVYSNPSTPIIRFVTFPFRLLRRIKTVLKKFSGRMKPGEDIALYFQPLPIKWWKRFSDVSNIKIMPWRAFGSDVQKWLIPNNKIGKKIFDMLFILEERFPKFFVKHFQYPMIILTKNPPKPKI
jgi:ubiquinone/menaquinone biosynthesis C-methylase UbiE